MTAIYQNKWTSQFATEQDLEMAINEWGEALHGLTGQQIKTALDKCRAEFKWPPAISEFIQAAKGKKNTSEQNGAAYKAFKSLPRPEQDPAKQKAAMSKMRGILSKKTAVKKPKSTKIHIPTQKECEIQPETGKKKPANRANNQLAISLNENIGANQ